MAGIIPEQKVTYFNNTPYIDNRMDYSNSAFSQLGAKANMLETQNMPWLLQRKQLIPLQPQQPAMQQPAQGAGNGMMTGKLPDMYNRLTMQANDALYGGILGYQPKPITSPTGNQYQPPANQGFQFPFGLLNRNFMGQ
jgi:hypothetical protein